MAYHITIIIKGKIDWEASNYQAVARGRRSNRVNLATAIEYTRAALLKGWTCYVQEVTEDDY